MLEGIQVLSETVKWTANCSMIFWGIFFGLVALFFLIGLIEAIIEKEFGLVLFALVLVLLSCGLSIITFHNYANRYQYSVYKVTIDDRVSFTEFNKKYKIIDQEGQIYTIVERNK